MKGGLPPSRLPRRDRDGGLVLVRCGAACSLVEWEAARQLSDLENTPITRGVDRRPTLLLPDREVAGD